MVWAWELRDASGTAIAEVPVEELGPANEFASQSDAETWIGEHWKPLLDAGVESVTLFEDDREVYGPMGLAPAEEPPAAEAPDVSQV